MTTLLEPLDSNSIIQTVLQFESRRIPMMWLVFTDGVTVAAPVDNVDTTVLEKNVIVVAPMFYLKYAIPFSQIAGLAELSFQQSTTPKWPYHPDTAYAKLTFVCAMVLNKRNIQVLPGPQTQQQFQLPKSIEFGPIEFLEDTPIYCDWHYLSQRRGELKALALVS